MQIKDSGERTEFASGALRDMHEGVSGLKYGLNRGLDGGVLLFCLAILVIPFWCIKSDINQSPCYEVVVDENVSLADFNVRYEIISVEGNKFTVKER